MPRENKKKIKLKVIVILILLICSKLFCLVNFGQHPITYHHFQRHQQQMQKMNQNKLMEMVRYRRRSQWHRQMYRYRQRRHHYRKM